MPVRDPVELVLSMPEEERRTWLRSLALDDATDLIQDAPGKDRPSLLAALDPWPRAGVSRLRIAQVAPLYESVPPRLYGGTERVAYHSGSVWPHDNALIAFGFCRYGFTQEASAPFQGLFEAAMYFELHRMPELFCGFPREPGDGPALYPVACSPQSWAAASAFLLLRSFSRFCRSS
jgi:hypothetical protein